MADSAKVTITKKHKYSMGTPDGGGNKRIIVTGAITMSSETNSTTSPGLGFDLSADIPNMEGVFVQGDAGYFIQYNYSSKAIEVYNVVGSSLSNALLTATTAVALDTKVFYFHAFGF